MEIILSILPIKELRLRKASPRLVAFQQGLSHYTATFSIVRPKPWLRWSRQRIPCLPSTEGLWPGDGASRWRQETTQASQPAAFGQLP